MHQSMFSLKHLRVEGDERPIPHAALADVLRVSQMLQVRQLEEKAVPVSAVLFLLLCPQTVVDQFKAHLYLFQVYRT